MGFFSSLFGTPSKDAYTTASARNAIVAHDGHTGVSRYLEGQTTAPSLSKVDKYLKSQELTQPSGVAKYLARQAIAERNKPVVVLTGVAKYLNNNKDSAPVVRSGVERYLARQDNTPMSGVAKYMLKKPLQIVTHRQNKKQHVLKVICKVVLIQRQVVSVNI